MASKERWRTRDHNDEEVILYEHQWPHIAVHKEFVGHENVIKSTLVTRTSLRALFSTRTTWSRRGTRLGTRVVFAGLRANWGLIHVSRGYTLWSQSSTVRPEPTSS